MKKKECNTVIRIKTYDEIVRAQKRTETFKVSSVQPVNTPSGQKIKIKQIDTKRRVNKKIVVSAAAILVVAISAPLLFAVASNTNEVSEAQAVSAPPALNADLAGSSAAPTPAATGGRLTSELMELSVLATPVPPPVALAAVVPAALASPTPLAAESAYETLSQGMTDPFVAMIQQRLMDLTYIEQDDPTTLYGPVTTQAVTDFQRQNGIAQTGVADAGTQTVLFSPAANPYIVRLGDSNPDVQSIQERLVELGFSVEISGTYGEDTQKAVHAFQTVNSLAADGNVGNDTRKALYSQKAKDASATPQPGAASKPNTPADPNKVEAFINAAMAQLGKSYVLGGKGPTIFDCSGLVYYSLKTSGNGIGYMTSYGWADAGEYQRIGSMKDLQRGDVVCESGHVGIYLGDGTVVNASSSNGNVIVSQNIFDSKYWKDNFICGRRPL